MYLYYYNLSITFVLNMASERNIIAKDKLLELNKKGFNFSYSKIAQYLCDNNIVKNGIPYERNDIHNALERDYTDENIVNAIDTVYTWFNKKIVKCQKYNQGVGAPRKTRPKHR